MPTRREIASDPRKALKDLENDLGVAHGTLIQDMERLGGDGDWRSHLPYEVAQSYFKNDVARSVYETHVDSCNYCKSLLETIHPTQGQIQVFAAQAASVFKEQQRRRQRAFPFGVAIPISAASILLTVIAIGFLAFQGYNVVASPAPERRVMIYELLTEGPKLQAMADSSEPGKRYCTALYYFAMKQSQLAYANIGQGLELEGLAPFIAERVKNAADLPRDSGKAINVAVKAAAVVENHQPSDRNPERLLQLGIAQAKLGLHDQSLESIRAFLEATSPKSRLLRPDCREFTPTVSARFERVLVND